MFIKSILEFIGVKIKTPITVYCNNVGAIFLAYNAKTGARTKHIDVKYHYVREFVISLIIRIDLFFPNPLPHEYLIISIKFPDCTS